MESQNRHGERTVSTKVVQEVAAVTNREATQLPPLYDTIDPEALDVIASSGGGDKAPVMIRFTYAGSRIVVSGTEEITVESPAKSSRRD